MKSHSFILILICLLFTVNSWSQDTLPKFSVKTPGGNNVIISWINQLDNVKQISIQTSHDSLKNYRTIMSVTDPNAKENGYADKAINDHMFYRLFIVKGNGEFFFTAAKQPTIDSFMLISSNIGIKPQFRRPDFVPSFYVYTNREGYVYINLPDADQRRYRIKFLEEDDSFLFELKNIKETGLTLDKANFLHSGWYKFELYNEDRLVEKNRFFLAREY